MQLTQLILILTIICIGTSVFAADKEKSTRKSLSYWFEFRKLASHHFQDWIVAGDGPTFTLIYSEPPPAYNPSEYEKLFQDTFRGLVSFQTKSEQLGFNGSFTDIVAHLDYSFADEDALREFEIDLRALSHEIYGTSYGARALRLRDLSNDPPDTDAGAPVQINASDLASWLFDDDLIFGSPETGLSGNIEALGNNRLGRYISTDGTLVTLIFDRTRKVEFSDIKHIRHFVLDSDLILGGVVDDKRDLIFLVGRARQKDLKDFPPLRVEDVLNLIEQENGSLAQSYDRTTPGAGRVTYEGKDQDWAPSYLSAELLDTEFGSLLNEADAILKSQSLANSTSYAGFEIAPIPGPPFEKGVWVELNKVTPLTSLIFNFNTLGSGHWLKVDSNTKIYASNRTGSYSVTYSPFASGEASLSDEASQIADAEKQYGTWFNESQNLALTRTVQYTSLFQIFKEPSQVAFSGYPDRSSRFDNVGLALKNSIIRGFQACLPESDSGSANFGALKEAFVRVTSERIRNDYANVTDAFVAEASEQIRNDFPKDKQELLELLSGVATKLRYDGNLFGSQNRELMDQYNALLRQEEAVLPKARAAQENYVVHTEYLKQQYRVDEQVVRGSLQEDGRDTVEVVLLRGSREWNPQQGKDGEDRSKWAELLSINNREVGYYNSLLYKRSQIDSTLDKLESEWGNKKEIADFVASRCDVIEGTNDTIFDTYQNWTFEDGAGKEADSNFLRTPTIVLSRNKLDPEFLGGHNVKRQGLEIEFSSSVGVDGFTFQGNTLELHPQHGGRLADLSEAMAKVKNADPAAQKSAFETGTSSNASGGGTRESILKISRNDRTGTILDGLAIHEASEAAAAPLPNSVRLGWGERGLYLDQTIDGKVRRSNLFGASYGLPQLLESRLAFHRTAVVEFDRSIDAATRNELISDFIRERPSTAAGGGGRGGDGNGRWRISGTSPDGPGRGPRLIIFTDMQTGRQRVVAETTRGRIEILFDRSVKSEALLRALSKPIERGASLELQTKIAADGLGARVVIADFKVQHTSEFSGSIAGFIHYAIKATNARIIEAFTSALKGAFLRVARSEPEKSTHADVLIEMRESAMATGYFRNVVGGVVIDKLGLRFILFHGAAPETGHELQVEVYSSEI
ncbi:hypothetical protein [Granulosicoccus antarcticus]|uniref:Uncharacterized protein n=1 Tax=Granulosicoccus antarcticus IMCC3135 TaxID=1192854 RepID=A0A2Z2NL97_9GAMM|nr:hypothetical protein [Granulosicoccus antarcticus]ASJ72106.1 hypothetical protein IMCC3135_10060 [Granulosicoccus antarcticus IMCC3135]